ncbi:hypothetical protein [Paenarthrobacter sp. YIM B13468]|uniref:hypothetical protein n=1 Tax=Paenarthrobacter sp. YIM B13468 TaxID=3366295 RepID=UPI003672E0BD
MSLTNKTYNLADVRLLAPITARSKIIWAVKNFAVTAEDLDKQAADRGHPLALHEALHRSRRAGRGRRTTEVPYTRNVRSRALRRHRRAL